MAGRAALITAAVLIFAAGYATRLGVEGKSTPLVQIRMDGYRYVQPLLECNLPPSPGTGHPDLAAVKKAVQHVVDQHLTDGSARTIGIYVRDLRREAWFGINDNERFTPASLMKVPLMMAVLKRAEYDSSLLARQLRYDGGNMQAFQSIRPQEVLHPGTRYAVDDLVFRMVAYSDNDAALLLADHLGMGILDDTIAALRIAVDPSRPDAFITVRDFSAFFRVLFNATYLDHRMSERALGYLAASTFAEGMRAGLPQDMVVASKFGEFSAGVYQLHEFGIVYYPEHPYLMGIVTKGGTPESLSHVLQEVSRAVYREFDRQHERAAHD